VRAKKLIKAGSAYTLFYAIRDAVLSGIGGDVEIPEEIEAP
jgi:hypothetical protein